MSPRAMISLIGRPNVGKSALFNRLIGKQNRALTHNIPGVTRDRHYEVMTIESLGLKKEVILVDTGGFYPDSNENEGLFFAMQKHSQAAIQESDFIVLVVDCREGPLPIEYQIVQIIRKSQKPFLVAVNKFDSYAQEGQEIHFFDLGVSPGQLYPISAAHGIGINDLKEGICTLKLFEDHSSGHTPFHKNIVAEQTDVRIAISGMPNSGKSTLLNQVIGWERALVSEMAGTTVDPVEGQKKFHFEGRPKFIRFVDTAGIRKKSTLKSYVEQHAIYRSLRCISESDIVLYLVDSTKGMGHQDKRLLNIILEKGKSLIICLNKIDLVDSLPNAKIPWAAFCDVIPMCAKSGKGLDKMESSLKKTLKLRESIIPTGELNRFFSKAISENPIILQKSKGVRLKVKYASMTKTGPPTFLLFTNRSQGIPLHYQRYLKNSLRKAFPLDNSPIHLIFRSSN